MGNVVGSVLIALAGIIAVRGMVNATTPDASVDETFASTSFTTTEELVAQNQPTGIQGAGRGLERQNVTPADGTDPTTGNANGGTDPSTSADNTPGTAADTPAPTTPVADAPTQPPVSALW